MDMISEIAVEKMQSCLTDLPKFDESDLKHYKVEAEPDYPHGERFVLRMPIRNFNILGQNHPNLVKPECIKSQKVENVRRDGEVFEMELDNLESDDVRDMNSKKHRLQVTISLE